MRTNSRLLRKGAVALIVPLLLASTFTGCGVEVSNVNSLTEHWFTVNFSLALG